MLLLDNQTGLQEHVASQNTHTYFDKTFLEEVTGVEGLEKLFDCFFWDGVFLEAFFLGFFLLFKKAVAALRGVKMGSEGSIVFRFFFFPPVRAVRRAYMSPT